MSGLNDEMLKDSEVIRAMRKNIEEYHRAVKSLFDQESSEWFPNNNEEHDAAITEEILLHAKKEIKIFCTCLKHDVWNNQGVINAFINAICRGVKFQIITQQNIDEGTELKWIINKAISNKELSSEISVYENIGEHLPYNFIVADRKMFRFEGNANKRQAVACANCPDIAIQLEERFDQIFSKNGDNI